MKVILLRNNLIDALNAVDKAVDSNPSLPILKHIKIQATDGNRITFISTNLELAITYTSSGKVVSSGEVVIPFDVFNNVVRNLSTEKINLELKAKQLLVQADNYEATIALGNVKEFPIIPDVQNIKESLSISQDTLKEGLSQALTATQFSEIRPEINGVFFSFENNILTLVGTDSFRLLEKKIDKKEVKSTFSDFACIVPLKTIESLLKIFEGDEDIEVFLDPNQILFKTNTFSVVSRLVDGTFPDYKAVIPKETPTQVFIERNELISAIKTTKTFSGRANDITFKLSKKPVLEVYSTDNTVGENNYRIPVKIKGDKNIVNISFNWRYILDGARVYKKDELMIGISTADKPVVIKSSKESEITYVVMPIKS